MKPLGQIASPYLLDRSHRVEQEIPAPYRTLVASNRTSDGMAGRVNLQAEGNTVPVKLLPVILNSKEEIGWKVQPQNSNLRQEIL